jgi:hypothetical protein
MKAIIYHWPCHIRAPAISCAEAALPLCGGKVRAPTSAKATGQMAAFGASRSRWTG